MYKSDACVYSMCLFVFIHMSAGAALEKVPPPCDHIGHYTVCSAKDRIEEDRTSGCLACDKYAVLPPCGRHGRLLANLTVSFIARKLIDLNNWRQTIIVRPIISTIVEENGSGSEKGVPRSTSTYTRVIFPTSWRKDVFGHMGTFILERI